MTKLKHLNVPGCVYFITTCTSGKEKIFLNYDYAQLVMDSILYARQQNWCYLLGFVVMPNHLHLAIVPLERKIPAVMQGIKGFTAREINDLRNIKGNLWQDGYQDFVMDNLKAIAQKLNYIEQNPVRAGLVKDPCDYPFSSASHREFLDLSYLA
jgi:putative transposase